MHMPTIASVMTPFPHSVGPEDGIAKVEALMEEHGIRHIPVQEGGRVVGLISERDLHHQVHVSLPEADKARIRARAVMLPQPFAVDITMPLAEVLSEMTRRHIGCVIVQRHDKLAGIFSATDACRLLAELLHDRFPGSDEAA